MISPKQKLGELRSLIAKGLGGILSKRVRCECDPLFHPKKGSGVYGKRAEAHATAEKYVHEDAGCHGFGGLSCGEHDDPPQYINFSETCGSGLVATGILFGYLALFNIRKIEENVFFYLPCSGMVY